MKSLFPYSLWLFLCAPLCSKADTLLDPTQPLAGNDAVASKVQQSSYTLQSIIKTDTAYKAIISGQIYQVGERLNDLRVLTITAKQVVLANDQKQIKLDLYHYEIKK